MAQSLPIDKWFEDIILLTPVVSTDSWGQPTVTYTEKTIQGRLRMLNGSEGVIGDKPTETSTHRLYTFENMTTNNKLKYDDKILNIVAVNNVMNFDRLVQVDCRYENDS